MKLQQEFTSTLPAGASVVTDSAMVSNFLNQGHPFVSLPGIGAEGNDDAYTAFLCWLESIHGIPSDSFDDPDGGEFDTKFHLDDQGNLIAHYIVYNPIADVLGNDDNRVKIRVDGQVVRPAGAKPDDYQSFSLFPTLLKCKNLNQNVSI